jgi:hypothetical protein
MSTKTKVGLFVAIFSVFLVAYLLLPNFSSTSDLAGLFDIFEDPTVNFIFLIISFLGLALVLTLLAHVIYSVVGDQRAGVPKIGEVMISEGFITPEDLETALLEQAHRVGEILVAAGRITPEQRDDALETQKMTKGKIGEILRQLGYATQEDIDWALNKMERKLGEILKDKKVLSDYDLTCALSLKKYHLKDEGKIFIIK